MKNNTAKKNNNGLGPYKRMEWTGLNLIMTVSNRRKFLPRRMAYVDSRANT
jgi:hypothetical protein